MLLFFTMFSVLYVVLLFLNHSFKSSDAIQKTIVFFAFCVFFVLTTSKSMDFGKDFYNYFSQYSMAYRQASFSDVLMLSEDRILVLYFFLFTHFIGLFGFEPTYLNFKCSIAVWFCILLGILVNQIKGKELFYNIALFILLLVGSRLFWENTSNTLRSFSASIFLFIYIYNRMVYGRFNFRNQVFLVISFLIHAKVTVLFILIYFAYLVFDRFLKPKAESYIFIILLAVFLYITKAAFSLNLIDFSGIKELVYLINKEQGIQMHSKTISNDNILPISLFVQYLFYCFYPYLLLASGRQLNFIQKFSCFSLLIFALTMPEMQLTERLSQLILLISLLSLTAVKNKVLFLAPVIIMNLATLAAILFQSNVF